MSSEQLAEKRVSRRVPVSCPVCDSERFAVKYRPTKLIDDPIQLYGAASGLPGTQTLVECSDCKMLYENPRFPEEDIIAGYSSANDAGHDSQYQMRVNSFYRALESMKQDLPAPGSNVLDIGCAGGAFLQAAVRYGYKVKGIEPSRYLVDQARLRGLDVQQGVITNHNYEPASFDLICLWDVLEHVVNPKAVLNAIRPLLKPNGTLLINYPDIGTWQAKAAGSKFWWLLSVHIQHFSPSSIRRIAELTGFKVAKFKSYWQTLQFGYLQKMAIHYKIPGSVLFDRVTPAILQRIPVPYYASQTTALLKVK